MKKPLFALLLAVASLALALSSAAAAEPLTASLEAFKVVVRSDGQESFVAAEKAAPGDVIEYRAIYTNTTDRKLSRIAPDIPIPEGLTWLAAAKATPPPVAASLDGAVFAPLPLRDASGQPVSDDKIRVLRWGVPALDPGQSVTITVRATVNRALPFFLPPSGSQQPAASN